MDPTTEVLFDEKKRCLRITLTGRHTDRTILEAFRLIVANPEVDRLWDIRKADLSGMDFTAVLGMTDDMASLPHVDSNVRVAILAGRDVEVGLSHMFQTLAEGRAPGIIKVFRTLEDAEAWLTEGPAD